MGVPDEDMDISLEGVCRCERRCSPVLDCGQAGSCVRWNRTWPGSVVGV